MFLTEPHKATTKKMKEIPKEALIILQKGFFAYLGTTEPGCDPHLTAMFFIWDDNSKSIYMISTRKSRKVVNIRRNTKVCVTVDERDPKSPAGNCGVMIQGRAQLVEMEIADDVVMVNFLDKYMHFLGPAYPMGSRIAIQVKPRKISYWMGANFYQWKNR
ncbi:MAG: pyridoxamine 5'-phosphate oxidase family protein [Candidatus Thorarchaeota archaeon]|jgi:nitroimidazol reductase NimA-like FMN-containing flavoprotein (pyridoxamine 5'-phosphate oxidase superfamily)